MNLSREEIRHIIFESNTPISNRFDVILLWAILISVLVVMLDSVPGNSEQLHTILYVAEWVLTILFSIEYGLRIWTTDKPLKYITSFYGIIDLLSVIPTYLSLIFAGTHYLLVIRTLRLLRVFRILRLMSFVKEASMLVDAINNSKQKLTVFMGAVLSIDVIVGTLMYLIEGPENGFTSIPLSIYWAIVTMTTVGYGDIAPHTVAGQILASIVMLLGYTIIAIPTGIVSATMVRGKSELDNNACPGCSKEGHEINSEFCKFCGAHLK